uniref:Uncharacterized protein n=1 Tax=Myoviridae sp. ctGrV43 TaxID=2825075 RepID=A0A8S5UF24_9CAUD|nr:MAG TPA: hypothetical protein [Myoviridae sp. ctGrV43]
MYCTGVNLIFTLIFLSSFFFIAITSPYNYIMQYLLK